MPTTPPAALAPFLTTAHLELWEQADAFATGEAAARVERMEAAPHQVERKLPQIMAKLGWFGVTIPAEYGGTGVGHVARTILIHRLAVVSAAAAAILQAGLIPIGALYHWGTPEQQAQWLPRAADGTVLLSIAVTEPHTGGHIGGIETIAVPAGNGQWVISGEKLHIGNSHLAGLHVVVARTAPADTTASRALTAFLVEHDRKGVSLAPHRARLGLHGFSAGRLILDRVRVPATAILGELGQGLHVAHSSSIVYGRPNLTALSLGLHEAFVSTTARWLQARPRYGARLADHPVVRDRLGAMQARLHHATSTAYHAVHLLDQGVPCDSVLISAKHTGHELAAATGRDAMELHGAYALDGDYLLQRLFRDIQHTYAPAGTGEFQRIHLANTALGTPTTNWSQQMTTTPSPAARGQPTAA
ncbi:MULTISPECIES: acyl-CoA dehydrogenase family protein [unclassified Streptomyces]|uniref:acyl-CoA dehydrogenase family protein n=1 Tax=unclassified Streptomyces TaxID=2593676 RepID=UPI0036E5B425